jgi:hypothetical protein
MNRLTEKSYLESHQAEQLKQHERTCILEAQYTARLLHNVFDEKGIVHDFRGGK